MSFQNFLDNLKTKASELKNEALKFKNKDFMNAAVSGSVLIAMADGHISSDEKQKMMRFIENYEALSVFSSKDLIDSFQNIVTQIEFDKDLGESKAYESVRKMKSNDSAARLIMRLIIAIAGADGVFDDDEKRVARKLAMELSLNPAEFELA
ncbi:tellurite resistance TerB family protein [Lamprobacter modestohalophilus]|uniref:Tellurite resistance TerB n=1 Tax=Lamprobacter modestohalophilus TaxID=1064514 RepID=A0A9X1B5D1_9GAMM|nr:tellurite resistance TerB family protein [Lamprobacter modestohalophilus]MBK1619532.1 Tellurite resistance TerB [Lamprobacter modestohalophilus]MEA1051803.1 tellurite resistance TerB family protein [Lamprobacter modestohalophilus]